MERMVYVQRNKDFGDWETIIMSTPLLFANPTTGPHPELVYELCQGPLNKFVDCTFNAVPRGFYQLIILMAYLPSYKTYVPIFYVLMQSKKHNAYKYVISNLVFQTD